jgi:hypothetical protein
MARNKLDDLRNHLFETLEALKDEEKPMELDRARTISEVAQTIINTGWLRDPANVARTKAAGSAQCQASTRETLCLSVKICCITIARPNGTRRERRSNSERKTAVRTAARGMGA